MKKPLVAAMSLLVVSWLAIRPASAASSAELTLSGRIIPSVCSVAVSNNGVFSVGNVTASDLNEHGMTSFLHEGTRGAAIATPKTTTITCSGDTVLALRIQDNRSGTASKESPPPQNRVSILNDHNFGLGLSSNGNSIGYVSFFLDETPPVLDSKDTKFLVSQNNGRSWQSPNWPRAFESHSDFLVSWGDRNPEAGRIISFPIFAIVSITDKSNLPLDKAVDIDGSVTIELIYL